MKALLALNCCLPQFAHDPDTLPADDRAVLLARTIRASGAGIIATQEADRTFLAKIAYHCGSRYRYQRAQGPDGRGLNGIIWRDEWTFERLHDWTLPSFGQWPRTFLAVRLTHRDGSYVWVGSTHYAAKAPDLDAAAANRAKLAQVKRVCELTDGYRQIIVGQDLARADDDDDLAYLKRQGWTLNGRSGSTPQCTMTKARVTPGTSTVVQTGQGSDHDAVLTTFTVPSVA